MDGLLGAAALAVDGGGRDRVGEIGGEQHVAGDVDALLADLVYTTEHDVLDHAGLDAGTLYDLVQHHCAEVVRVDAGKDTGAPAHGGANGLYDYNFSHWGSLLRYVRQHSSRRSGRPADANSAKDYAELIYTSSGLVYACAERAGAVGEVEGGARPPPRVETPKYGGPGCPKSSRPAGFAIRSSSA